MRKSKPNILSEGILKPPPSAVPVEKAVLGAALNERDAIDTISELLTEDSFYTAQHQLIFKAMLALHRANKLIDILTVNEELIRQGTAHEAGSPSYLMQISGAVSSTTHLGDHVKIVYERHLARQLIVLGHSITAMAYEPDRDVFELLDAVGRDFHGLSIGHQKSTYHGIERTSFDAMDEIEKLRHRSHEITGVPTGYRILDRITFGWQPGELIVIAARPSVGKSALAINLARNAAANPHKPTPVGFFSLEMGRSDITKRILSSESRVPLEKIRRAKLDDHEMKQLYEFANIIGKYKIFIDDTTFLNIYELRAKARRMVEKHKVGLIIVDYLQLMAGTEEGRGSQREQNVSAISRGLKGMAKELNVPVIALSQLSREVEKRKPPVPMLSDLRESGAIEQDADIVMFLSRADYQQEADQVDPSLTDKAEIKFAKYRNGDLETIPFYAVGKITTWMEDEQYQRYKNAQTLGPGLWTAVKEVETF